MKKDKKDILHINALLKYIEFLLYYFDHGDKKMTLDELRNLFKTKYSHNDILLNQHFGIIRLMPLILIKEVYKSQKKKFNDGVQKIKVMRDAISHNNFSINRSGYLFKNNHGELKMTFLDFQKFLQKVEYEFYNNKTSSKNQRSR